MKLANQGGGKPELNSLVSYTLRRQEVLEPKAPLKAAAGTAPRPPLPCSLTEGHPSFRSLYFLTPLSLL